MSTGINAPVTQSGTSDTCGSRMGVGGRRAKRRAAPFRCLAVVAILSAGCAAQGQFPDGQQLLAMQSAPLPAPPQPYIYPNRGQSPQQEQFDRGQCYSWAVQQSGFDPANPRVATEPPPSAQPPQGGPFRGALGGAALGAVGGAIGGNAGEGAAIGAGVGALFGAMRRARWAEEQQQAQATYAAQQQAAVAQGRANYNRAFGVCMTGRGYTVQ
jgi:hypothetical protein